MKLYALAATAVLGVCLSGCASVIKGPSDSIAIATPPASGATCTLTNARGSWTVVSPGEVKVKRSKTDIDVACKKEGYADAKATIPSDFQAWTLGNLIIGGLIGIGVDAGTGAMNDYPNSFSVPMSPSAPPPTAAAPAAPAASGAQTNS